MTRAAPPRRAGLLALMAVLALLGTAIARPAAAPAPADRPSYAVGEQWILGDGAYELTRADRHGYVFSRAPDRQIHLTRDLVISRVSAGAAVDWELWPAPALAWPLAPGKWGVRDAVFKGPDHPSGVDVQVTWQVTGPETVRVAAGSFEALRVEYRVEIKSQQFLARVPRTPGPQAWSLVTWYAPAARRIVAAQTVGARGPSLELAALAPSPPEPPAVAATGGGSRVPAPVAPSPPREPSITTPAPVVAGAPRADAPAAAGPAVRPPAAAPAPAPVAPLTIEIRHPADGVRLASPSSLVVATVGSGKGVAGVDVLVNGTLVDPGGEPRSGASVVVTAPITVRPGPNVVTVRATEVGGRVETRTVAVVYEPPSAVAGVPASEGERWAVVIGIGRYDHSSIPALPYAVADARAVRDILVSRAGFKPENVLHLADGAERKPTLRNVKWALGTFLARSARKDDVVVVYFAGHGAPEIDPRGLEPDGLAKYLVPSDADPNDLYATGLPMDEFQTIFERVEAERMIVFLDTCYSGAAGGRTFASRRTRATRVDDLFLERLARSRGRAIITASRANEVSVELPELGHGLFTHYLLQGLRGLADLDRDGIVTLQELYQYLEREVARRSRALGGNQHPVMRGELEGLLPLVKVSRPAERR